MGKLWRRYDIADGVNARLSRFAIFIDLDGPAIRDLYLCAFKPQALQISHPPNGNEQHLGLERDLGALVIFARHPDNLFGLFHFVELEARLDLDALFFE